MFGPRLLLGAAIGGALVYFLDPQNGVQRRERVRVWWEQNREPVMERATSAANAAQVTVSETSARVGDKLGEVGGKMTEAGGRANEKVAELRSKVRS
jgi:gas vesicle protein